MPSWGTAEVRPGEGAGGLGPIARSVILPRSYPSMPEPPVSIWEVGNQADETRAVACGTYSFWEAHLHHLRRKVLWSNHIKQREQAWTRELPYRQRREKGRNRLVVCAVAGGTSWSLRSCFKWSRLRDTLKCPPDRMAGMMSPGGAVLALGVAHRSALRGRSISLSVPPRPCNT